VTDSHPASHVAVAITLNAQASSLTSNNHTSLDSGQIDRTYNQQQSHLSQHRSDRLHLQPVTTTPLSIPVRSIAPTTGNNHTSLDTGQIDRTCNQQQSHLSRYRSDRSHLQPATTTPLSIPVRSIAPTTGNNHTSLKTITFRLFSHQPAFPPIYTTLDRVPQKKTFEDRRRVFTGS